MRKIKVKIYDTSIELYIGKSRNNIRKIIKRHGKKYKDNLNCNNDYYAFTCCIPKKSGKVYILSIPKRAVTIDIFHESLHLAYLILHNTGVKINVRNQEPLAYLQGFIANEVRKRLYKGY